MSKGFDKIVKGVARVEVYEDAESEESVAVGYTKGGVEFGITPEEITYEVDNYGTIDVETSIEEAYISFDSATFNTSNLEYFIGGDVVVEDVDGGKRIRRKVTGESPSYGKVVATVDVKGGQLMQYILYNAKAVSDGVVRTEDKDVGTISIKFVATHDGSSDYYPFEYRIIERDANGEVRVVESGNSIK